MTATDHDLASASRELLRAFEVYIATAFNRGEIKAPVHLSGGNETQLIAYFGRFFAPGDWVFSTWRSHYHALLAGVPPEEVRARVLAGRSITLCFPEHRFVSSAIVGGTVAQAVGVGMALRCAGSKASVHCFVGDMAARSGIFHEAREYALGHDLPVYWVIEDNGLSVLTKTTESWDSTDEWTHAWRTEEFAAGVRYVSDIRTARYRYDLEWPHSGAAARTNF